MATISFAKSAAVMNIFNSFSKTPSICIPPSSSVSFRKVSKVGFASGYSSFNANQVRNIAANEMKCRAKDASAEAAEKTDEGVAKATELSDGGKAKATKGHISDTILTLGLYIKNQLAMSGLVLVFILSTHVLGAVNVGLLSPLETASAESGELQAGAKDKAGSLKDNAVEAKEKAAEKASKLIEKAKDAVQGASEAAKENVNKAWEATKDATQNMKDGVAGKEKENLDDAVVS